MRKVLVGLVSVGLMLEMLCACGSQTEKVIQNEVNNEKSPVEIEETERDVKITHINNASNAFAVGAIAEKSNT